MEFYSDDIEMLMSGWNTLYLRKQTYDDEMNNKRFYTDMNVWDTARKVIQSS
jgi:hypothetical protein